MSIADAANEMPGAGDHDSAPDSPQQIVAYTPSESATPSPLLMDVFGDMISSFSRPTSPSPQRTPTNPPLADPTLAEDATMNAPPPYNGRPPLPQRNPAAATRSRPLSLSHSEGNIQTTRAPPQPRIDVTFSANDLLARLDAAAERNAAPRNTPHAPVDRFTNAPMPTVHYSSPTAPMEYLDRRLHTEWVKYPGNKLLAIPFGSDVRTSDLHDGIKSKIHTEVANITNSSETCISAPKRSADVETLANGKTKSPTPMAFLIYNISEAHRNALLLREVWSSTNISFRVVKLEPRCPDYLFSLVGLSIGNPENVLNMIQATWQEDDVAERIESIVNVFPEDSRSHATSSLHAFLNSVSVSFLNMKNRDSILDPYFNVYTDGSIIHSNDLWIHLREFLASRTYSTLMLGQARVKIFESPCGICHGADHPLGLCPFPDIPGWNGPKKPKPGENRGDFRGSNFSRDGRGGRGDRGRGPSTRGRR